MEKDSNVKYTYCLQRRVEVPYTSKRISADGAQERKTLVTFVVNGVSVDGKVPASISIINPKDSIYDQFRDVEIDSGIGDSQVRYQAQRKEISSKAYDLVIFLMQQGKFISSVDGGRGHAYRTQEGAARNRKRFARRPGRY
jgi:hypothetical protein